MGHHFLLVEGVNLYANIYDTDQLSVIRGSSFLYKDAVTHIKEQFEADLEAVSTGASSGLFCLKAQATQAIGEIAKKVAQKLRDHEDFRYLTFGVECCEAASLQQAKELLWTQLRFHQLQNFTMQPDWAGSDRGQFGQASCDLAGTRIVSVGHKKTIQGKERNLSSSAYHRWDYGREQRHSYYHDLLTANLRDVLKDYDFAEDINTLCADPNYPLDKDGKPPEFDPKIPVMYPKLAGKMAVVYIDGNQFSDRQREFITHYIQNDKSLEAEIKAQQTFDVTIQDLRNRFLQQVVQGLVDEERSEAINPLGHRKHNRQRKIFRLETLLWGGDEMLLVMPAWKGMDFLQQFFAFDWQLEGVEKPLTHAAGIVFCQAKTPIRIIQQLARKLADRVKDGKDYGRKHNAWDYLVLESIDYPTTNDLDDYFKTRYPNGLSTKRSHGLPAIPEWQKIRKQLQTVLEERHLPRRKLYHVLQELRQSGIATTERTWEQLVKLEDSELQDDKQVSAQEREEHRLYEVSEFQIWLKGNGDDDWPALAKRCFGLDINNPAGRAWAWIHAVELWDYFAPKPSQAITKQEAAA